MEEKTSKFEQLVTKLYDAALVGDTSMLHKLLLEDPLLLDRCSIKKFDRYLQTPLHVAANFGHLEFAKQILLCTPVLAEKVDHLKRSPLHIASAKGQLEIVRCLLALNPNLCFLSDQDGHNPVHLAAVRSHIHVLDELIQTVPQAARECTHSGESVLHLCVKYSQFEALKFLTTVMDDGELLSFKDSGSNTILHLAMASKQLEMVKYLLKDKRLEKNVINKNGLTAMDIYNQRWKDTNDKEIWSSLKRAKALRAKDARNKEH